MIQLACLLMGADFIRKRATGIFWLSILWGCLGLFIFLDALDGDLYFPIKVFAVLLLIDSFFTLFLSLNCHQTKKILLFFKGILFFFIALLILIGNGYSNLLLAIILGFSYFLFGLLTISSSLLVRQKTWRWDMFKGCLNIIFSILLFIPYHAHHQGSFELFLGILMMTGAITMITLSLKLKQIKSGSSIFALFFPDDTFNDFDEEGQLKEYEEYDYSSKYTQSNNPLIIHIWTPEDSAKTDTYYRPIMNRYIAAIDREGRISTGHAALEVKDKLYISLYPKEDIDRSPSEFFNTIRATPENTVSGEYKSDYLSESKNWTPSTIQIVFKHYDLKALEQFWRIYQKNQSYNLTYRNCSSSVAYALEAALDGTFSHVRQSKTHFLRLLVQPELWIAAQIRQKAKTMAWTPGLVMDYARSLNALIYTPETHWYALFLSLFQRKR